MWISSTQFTTPNERKNWKKKHRHTAIKGRKDQKETSIQKYWLFFSSLLFHHSGGPSLPLLPPPPYIQVYAIVPLLLLYLLPPSLCVRMILLLLFYSSVDCICIILSFISFRDSVRFARSLVGLVGCMEQWHATHHGHTEFTIKVFSFCLRWLVAIPQSTITYHIH